MFPVRLTTTHKVVAISVAAGVALLGVLARYLKRKKTPLPQRRQRKAGGRRTRNINELPSDMISVAGSKASARSLSPGGSLVALSDRLSLASGSVGPGLVAGIPLTPQQLGALGMESFESCINYWEEALEVHYAFGDTHLSTHIEDSEFCREIQTLLNHAYTLQDQSELLFLDQRSVLFRDESIAEMSDKMLSANKNQSTSDPNLDSAESFASALDQVADLRDFDEFSEALADMERYPLYQSAIQHSEEQPIPYRMLRTELTNCSSDMEYLAKLHCIRLAFQFLFRDIANSQWVVHTGRQILVDLLCLGDKDPKDFIVGYEGMMNFLQEEARWPDIEQELQARNVKAMTFFDVVIDFIILDAFKDLDNPPASVLAVVQNRFLSNGFKETALTTAVWSVLKAKRRLLRHPNGFMAHFYIISEQISPLMAWGFFGPDENLHDVCQYFRDQTLGFLVDIFNFQKCRYTTVEELSEDINAHIKSRVNNIGVKFNQ